jgi:hypothetical protein
MVVGLTMLAAAVYVVLGEKDAGVSPSLWNVAAVLCRVITGLFGLLAIAPAVVRRGAGSTRDDTLGSVATAVVLIASAVVGLRLVIVITGLGGIGLLYAAGATALNASRSRPPEPEPPPRPSERLEPVPHRLHSPALVGKPPSADNTHDHRTTNG